jgi:glucose-6-phosphate isomerase
MTFDTADITNRLLTKDATLFVGETAKNSLGWIDHPTRYLGSWIEEIAKALPSNTAKTVLLGMGGSSSPARFYAEAKNDASLRVLDTSNPDSIDATSFDNCVVIASSKSGTTIETQTLLAHALANGLSPKNLVVITDPGSSLVELGHSLGAVVVLGDPSCGGRFSAISPFGLIPALYAGWSVKDLQQEHLSIAFDQELVARAQAQAAGLTAVESNIFPLASNPLSSGSSLWLEQLIAETTGKDGLGLVPLWTEADEPLQPREMMFWQLVAAFSARELRVDPFNQPNVESAKKAVMSLLLGSEIQPANHGTESEVRASFQAASVRELNVYCPIENDVEVEQLRREVRDVYGDTSANIGPRYLHSTGQLFKGGPTNLSTLQIIVRPKSSPVRISGRRYSFHDLFYAQAIGDFEAMKSASRTVWQLVVDDLAEARALLGLSA